MQGWKRIKPGRYAYRNAAGELLAGIQCVHGAWFITLFPLADRARKVQLDDLVFNLAEAKRRAQNMYDRLSAEAAS